MSSFVVQDQTINRLTTFFSQLEHRDVAPEGYLKQHNPFTFSTTQHVKDDEVKKLAQDMYDLNMAAYCDRYRDKPDGREFPFKYQNQQSLWQTLKHLDCFLYQCMEGDVPKVDLYKKLEAFNTAMCRVMAHSTKQYDDAAWS